jgi:hypothetical protein
MELQEELKKVFIKALNEKVEKYKGIFSNKELKMIESLKIYINNFKY